MEKVRWGIISTAKIAREAVLPALKKAEFCRVDAIASRDADKSSVLAREFAIPKHYGSYDELLTDPGIDAVYIPLPNHLHVEWSLKALEHGKHVLCEKPLSLSVEEILALMECAQSNPHLLVMEAFMYKFHPQWIAAKEIIHHGGIGDLRGIQSVFSFFDTDPQAIFNNNGYGGGSLMDIGCYSVSLSRFLFETEPVRVCSAIEFDPAFQTDRLTSGILEFEKGMSTFICSTQIDFFQRVLILGTKGSIEIMIPFNPPVDRPTVIRIQHNDVVEERTFYPCNHYTLQFDSFSKSVLYDLDTPMPLEDSLANRKVIDAIFSSAKRQGWINL